MCPAMVSDLDRAGAPPCCGTGRCAQGLRAITQAGSEDVPRTKGLGTVRATEQREIEGRQGHERRGNRRQPAEVRTARTAGSGSQTESARSGKSIRSALGRPALANYLQHEKLNLLRCFP
jgi:hypothetical protein